jgi:O-acetyl-ADP-ribose deacetylase (regulator of RNase III)
VIKYVKGDLFESGADIIAHGCNCVGGFGSGVAGQIAKRYPRVRNAYLERHEELGWELGDVQFVYAELGKGLYIANCATQKEYYPRDRVHADYDAIRTAMTRVKQWAKGQGKSVAIPKIGAGLAGGDWNRIEAILKEVFDDYDVTVYTLD